jgi:pimeloyl-ACP methyl ester carboxylesterase
VVWVRDLHFWTIRRVCAVALQCVEHAFQGKQHIVQSSPHGLSIHHSVHSFYGTRCKPTPTIINTYRWPSLCERWREGMVEFLMAAVSESVGLLADDDDDDDDDDGDGDDDGDDGDGGGGGGRKTSHLPPLGPGLSHSHTHSHSHSTTRDLLGELKAAMVPELGPANRGPGATSTRDSVTTSGSKTDLRVLIIHGDADPLVPLACAQAIAEDLPRAKLVVMEGVGHMPHEEDPTGFAGIVGNFVNGDLEC